jgi:hypothetical protein
MARFLAKKTKELKIGFQETLRFVGLRDGNDDPDYTARAATLDQIDARYQLITRSLTAYQMDIQPAAFSCDVAYNILKDLDAPPGGLAAFTAGHLQGPLQRCTAPLTQFYERLRGLRRLQTKRGRNRDLLPSGDDPAHGERAEKYLRYHTAFLRGVDALAALAPAFFDQLFAHEQWCMRAYARGMQEELAKHPPPPPPQEAPSAADVPPVEPEASPPDADAPPADGSGTGE